MRPAPVGIITLLIVEFFEQGLKLATELFVRPHFKAVESHFDHVPAPPSTPICPDVTVECPEPVVSVACPTPTTDNGKCCPEEFYDEREAGRLILSLAVGLTGGFGLGYCSKRRPATIVVDDGAGGTFTGRGVVEDGPAW